nr:hypothetical protein [Spirochaetota bacterium]
MKKIILFILVLFLITGCKTTQKVDKETEGKILFKNLVKSSESLSDIYVSGLFRLSGVKEIPAAFINFESSGNFKNKNISFKISFLRKPLIQIRVAGEDITFINHSGKQYIKLKYENIDFSKFIGINFNPLEISYFFVGKIPYSSDIQLMSCNFTKNGTLLELT